MRDARLADQTARCRALCAAAVVCLAGAGAAGADALEDLAHFVPPTAPPPIYMVFPEAAAPEMRAAMDHSGREAGPPTGALGPWTYLATSGALSDRMLAAISDAADEADPRAAGTDMAGVPLRAFSAAAMWGAEPDTAAVLMIAEDTDLARIDAFLSDRGYGRKEVENVAVRFRGKTDFRPDPGAGPPDLFSGTEGAPVRLAMDGSILLLRRSWDGIGEILKAPDGLLSDRGKAAIIATAERASSTGDRGPLVQLILFGGPKPRAMPPDADGAVADVVMDASTDAGEFPLFDDYAMVTWQKGAEFRTGLIFAFSSTDGSALAATWFKHLSEGPLSRQPGFAAMLASARITTLTTLQGTAMVWSFEDTAALSVGEPPTVQPPPRTSQLIEYQQLGYLDMLFGSTPQ